MNDQASRPVETPREWLRYAEGDLGVAEREMQYETPAYHTVCFLCQSAAEKFLKGYLTLLKKGCLTAEHAEIAEIFNFRIDFPKVFIKKQMTPLKKGCLTAEHAEIAEIFNFRIDFPKVFIEKHKFV